MESTLPPYLSIPELNASLGSELEKWQPSRSVTSAESAASSVRIAGTDPEKQEALAPRTDVDPKAPAACPPVRTESEHASPREQERVIPPADGGSGAWLFLAGCFGIEALVWGKSWYLGHYKSRPSSVLCALPSYVQYTRPR